MSKGIGYDPIPVTLSPDSTALQLKNGPKTGQKFSLSKMRNVIGRSSPPHIVVDIDLSECELDRIPMISRRHAVIEWSSGELLVTDLGSSNGTFIDGQQLKPEDNKQPSPPLPLKAGSKLVLANLEFELITAV